MPRVTGAAFRRRLAPTMDRWTIHSLAAAGPIAVTAALRIFACAILGSRASNDKNTEDPSAIANILPFQLRRVETQSPTYDHTNVAALSHAVDVDHKSKPRFASSCLTGKRRRRPKNLYASVGFPHIFLWTAPCDLKA